jgi:hypothetical protein
MKAAALSETTRNGNGACRTCKYRSSKTSGNPSSVVELSFDRTGTFVTDGSDESRVSNMGVAVGLERRVIQKANGEGS